MVVKCKNNYLFKYVCGFRKVYVYNKYFIVLFVINKKIFEIKNRYARNVYNNNNGSIKKRFQADIFLTSPTILYATKEARFFAL